MNGILLVDKPKGWTSFDVVAKVRGIIRGETGTKIKVGHSGTLDPQATGLLVLAIGKATKTISELTKLDKVYQVTGCLGKTSTTDDSEGEITDTNAARITDRLQLEDTLMSFVGDIEQVPPQFSAIKIDGKRAYKLARAGKQVEMKPRKVTIHEIRDIHFDWPAMQFVVDVSSGTYIRSLVRDIGIQLGTGAYMSDLRRTQIGEYQLNEALSFTKNTTYEEIEDNLRSL